VEEAKTHYRRARTEGREIRSHEGKLIDCFVSTLGCFVVAPTVLKEGQVAARLIDETGDRRIVWDSRDPEQTEESFELFQSYIKRGWKAYGINRDGSRGRRIYGFDAGREEIVVDERGTTERLAKFRESFKEVAVLPRTTPG
jgi:hypothetical protein